MLVALISEITGDYICRSEAPVCWSWLPISFGHATDVATSNAGVDTQPRTTPPTGEHRKSNTENRKREDLTSGNLTLRRNSREQLNYGLRKRLLEYCFSSPVNIFG